MAFLLLLQEISQLGSYAKGSSSLGSQLTGFDPLVFETVNIEKSKFREIPKVCIVIRTIHVDAIEFDIPNYH